MKDVRMVLEFIFANLEGFFKKFQWIYFREWVIMEKFRVDLFSRMADYGRFRVDLFSRMADHGRFRVDLFSRIFQIRENKSTRKLIDAKIYRRENLST